MLDRYRIDLENFSRASISEALLFLLLRRGVVIQINNPKLFEVCYNFNSTRLRVSLTEPLQFDSSPRIRQILEFKLEVKQISSFPN